LQLISTVVEGEIAPQLTFFSDEEWFHLQGYINTQNNRYWNSQNSHLTHEVLHAVEIGVRCAISARVIVGPVIFNETINCERYVQVILGQFFPVLTVEERFYGWFQRDSVTAHSAPHVYVVFVRCLRGRLSAVIFCQHVHPILILVIFFYSAVV
jgi:hypothetical protein